MTERRIEGAHQIHLTPLLGGFVVYSAIRLPLEGDGRG